MKTQQHILFIGLLFCCGILSSNRLLASDDNLLVNPGFETSTLAPWIVQPPRNSTVSTEDFIDGNKSFRVGHNPVPKTTAVSQDFSVGPQLGLSPGTSYLFSVNAKVEGGNGQIELFAEFDSGTNTNHKQTWPVAGVTGWQKYQFKFQIPDGATSLKIGCRFKNTSGPNRLDYAKLYPYKNLITNGDFEDPGSWTTTHSFPNTVHRHFGNRSLRISGQLNQRRWSAQAVDLEGQVANPDRPVYTISAHVKTLVLQTSTSTQPVQHCNSDDDDERLDPLEGSGTQIQINCLDGNKFLRRLSFPFFEGRSTEFTEQKFSFLVPRKTNRLLVALVVENSKMHAFYDNVRLTYDEVPPNEFVSQVGHTARVVEAPEPKTYVIPSGHTDVEITSAIDDVTNFNSTDYGKIVWLPRNDYLIKTLITKTRLRLKMHQDARLNRDPTGYQNFWGSILRSDPWEQFRRVSDVVVEGGSYRPSPSTGADNNNLGNVVAIFGDRIVFRNHFIPEWSQETRWEDPTDPTSEVANSDIAVNFLGHDVYVYNNTIVGPAGNLGDGTGPGQGGFDALHLFGGNRAHFFGNHVYSGDDGIGLFAGTIPEFRFNCATEPKRLFIYNRNISDVEIYNNRLSSNSGRTVACGLARPRSFDSDLTSTVTNVRARNVVGRLGGAASALAIVCSPRRPMRIVAGQQCPTASEAASDSALFPTRAPQIRDIQFANMFLTVDIGNPFNVRPVQHAVRLYSEDVGSLDSILVNNVTIWTINSTGREWPEEDRPVNLVSIARAGLLCQHFDIDPVTGEEVATGFSTVGISNRNFNLRVKNCNFFDNTGTFRNGGVVSSTELQANVSDDVNDVFSDNVFSAGLPKVWRVLSDGVH